MNEVEMCSSLIRCRREAELWMKKSPLVLYMHAFGICLVSLQWRGKSFMAFEERSTKV